MRAVVSRLCLTKTPRDTSHAAPSLTGSLTETSAQPPRHERVAAQQLDSLSHTVSRPQRGSVSCLTGLLQRAPEMRRPREPGEDARHRVVERSWGVASASWCSGPLAEGVS